MLKLVTAFALVASTGCIIDAHDDGRDYGGGANITAKWELRDVATDRVTSCPQGFLTTTLVTQLVDENGQALADPVADLFSCNDGFGVSDPLAADRQLTWLEVRSDDGTQLYAKSTSAIVDLYDTDATFEATILNDGGYFSLQWNLVGKQSNQQLSCGDIANLDTIEAISTTGTTAVSDKFTCNDDFGITAGLLEGNYSVTVDAQANGRPIGTSSPIAKPILDRNQVTNLGAITIPVNGL